MLFHGKSRAAHVSADRYKFGASGRRESEAHPTHLTSTSLSLLDQPANDRIRRFVDSESVIRVKIA
jgi:hypothetical protein